MIAKEKLTRKLLVHLLEELNAPFPFGFHGLHALSLQFATGFSLSIITLGILVLSLHLESMSFGLKNLSCALLALFLVIPDKLCNLGLVISLLLRHRGVMIRLKLLYLGLHPCQFSCSSFGFSLLLCAAWFG